MLMAGKEIKGLSLEAADGRAGRVEDLYFGFGSWRIGYWVANPGPSRSERDVLIPPEAAGMPLRERRILPVRLTRGQVRGSPDRESAAGHGEERLLSMAEVRGYRIASRDGESGHVEDFLLDPGAARILYLVIDPVNFLPGKHVIIPVSWAEGVDGDARILRLSRPESDVRYVSPKYGGPDQLAPEFEDYLRRYFDWAEAAETLRR